MWPHPLVLTPSLLLLPFTRDHKPVGPVQVMLCRTWVTMESPEHQECGCGVSVHPWEVCGATAGPSIHCLLPLDASWSWDYSRAALANYRGCMANYRGCKTKSEALGAQIREAASRRACRKQGLDPWPLNLATFWVVQGDEASPNSASLGQPPCGFQATLPGMREKNK